MSTIASSRHFKPIIDLNNAAVVLMKKNENRKAATLLKTALAELKRQFPKNQSTAVDKLDDDARLDSRYSTSPEFSSLLADSFSFSSLGETDTDILEDGNESNCLRSVQVMIDALLSKSQEAGLLAIYDRGLHLGQQNHIGVISAVIVYNMALVHHCRGLACGKSKYLVKARQMYKIAFQICSIASKTKQTQGRYLLSLAALNNMTQIDSIMAASNGAMILNLILIREMLCLARDSQDDAQLDFDDYSWFYTNVAVWSLFGSATTRTAAAA